MAFGSHPDDVELQAGGTLISLAGKGHRVGICDLTGGEAGTRGTVATRQQEAADASKIMGLSVRKNLGIPDTLVRNTRENQLTIIRILRRYRPYLVFAPHWDDRHPDHKHTSVLVKEASFFSGLQKIETDWKGQKQVPYRPSLVVYYNGKYAGGPSFVVDISDVFEKKMQAILAYKTQFHTGQASGDEPVTYISREEFLDAIRARDKYYGSRIETSFGEAFFVKETLGMVDPVAFFRESRKKIDSLGLS